MERILSSLGDKIILDFENIDFTKFLERSVDDFSDFFFLFAIFNAITKDWTYQRDFEIDRFFYLKFLPLRIVEFGTNRQVNCRKIVARLHEYR